MIAKIHLIKLRSRAAEIDCKEFITAIIGAVNGSARLNEEQRAFIDTAIYHSATGEYKDGLWAAAMPIATYINTCK
ncbi:MAG: hypothetical protein KGI49_00495 [Patescibacteria group bacterium]|nr:hypothetical protein [Patescibacteria group bacterium]